MFTEAEVAMAPVRNGGAEGTTGGPSESWGRALACSTFCICLLDTSSPESPRSPLGSLSCQRHLGHQLEGCDSLKCKGFSTALDTQ